MARTEEFVKMLGTKAEIVAYVQMLERTGSTAPLRNFFSTNTGKRYLMAKTGPTRVVDLRHFFAAMYSVTEGYNGFQSRSEGGTLILGVANELRQCAAESFSSLTHLTNKINSCFSNEDLGSNRMGGAFGEFIKVKKATASTEPLSRMLDEFLGKFDFLNDSEVAKLQLNTGGEMLRELLLAFLLGLRDSIISKAY